MFRRFQVDNQLELRRLLDGEVCRFCAFQDLVNVNRRAAIQLRKVRTVRHQAAAICILFRRIDCRQPVSVNKCENLLSMSIEHPVAADEDRSGSLPFNKRKAVAEIFRISRFYGNERQGFSAGPAAFRCLNCVEHVGLAGFERTATRDNRVTTSLSNSKRFVTKSA